MSFNASGRANVSKQKIYFAYGSNLHLRQMARRCPESRFLGRATLYGYRWQINERGYANVVKVPSSPWSAVQGLCYLLNADDERALDRSEGVPTAYEKRMLKVDLVTASPVIVGRDVAEIINWSKYEVRASRNPVDRHRGPEGDITEALVYLSQRYIIDDVPQEEYITRMRLALKDAVDLGLSKSYTKAIGSIISAGENEALRRARRRQAELRAQQRHRARRVAQMPINIDPRHATMGSSRGGRRRSNI